MKFRKETLGFRILIKPFIEKKTASGIVIAKDERRQAVDADKGIVFMIGKDAWKDYDIDTPVKVGDTVIYAKYGAKVIKDEENDELYIICNDEDILVGIEA